MRNLGLLFAIATCGFALSLVTGSTASPPHADHAIDGLSRGVAVLIPTNDSDVRGSVLFEQREGVVHISGKVTGLTPGLHGFHIHEFGDVRDPSGKSAGGHFDPCGTPHAGPGDHSRHVGDLGNVTADEEGVALIAKQIPGASLHFILGRSIVVHADEDDLHSQPSGNAGDRIAVGVIGITK